MGKWETVRLGDVFKLSSGKGLATKKRVSGAFNVYGGNGITGCHNEYFVEKSTIIIGRVGENCGATHLTTDKCWITDNALMVTEKLKEYDNNYLVYLLSYLNINKYANTSGQPSISQNTVYKIEIPLPPLEIQQEIARNLDLASELVKLHKSKLEELDKLIQSVFYDMFGDPVANEKMFSTKTLQSLIDENIIIYHLDGNHGGLYPRTEEFIDSGVPYISANSIKNGRVNLSYAKYLSRERAEKFRKGVAENGDILFAHNATVGPVAYLNTEEDYVILGTSLTSYRCNTSFILPYYLKSYMESPGFKTQYLMEMSQTTRNQIPITTQRKYLFLLPPLPLQQKFADIVTEIEAQKAQVQQALNDAWMLYDSLMQEYFE